MPAFTRGSSNDRQQRLAAERGFTLIELLVVVVIIGILAGIALTVFLNQQDKGRDSSAKSDVTNLVHEIQSCHATAPNTEDFRDCDTASEIGPTGLAIGSDAPNEIASGDCSDAAPADSVTGGTVRVLEAGRDCFTVLGISGSGNRFWYVKHDGATFSRDCSTRGVNGCPGDGGWAG